MFREICLAIHKTEAIVLKKMDFRDTSLIVTLFTRDFGKVKVVVKGVRKESSSDLVHFEILNQLNVVFYEKKKTELHLLSESFLQDPMLSSRSSFRNLVFGAYLAELVDATFEPHQISKNIYDSFYCTLKNMEKDVFYFWILYFELRFLKEVGWFPNFGKEIDVKHADEHKIVWSSEQGGVVFLDSPINSTNAWNLEKEHLELLRDLNSRVFQDVMEPLADSAHLRAIEKVIREFIHYRLDRPLKTERFLSKSQIFIRENKVSELEV